MKRLYLLIIITFIFTNNNTFSIDFANINKKEQATIYQNERNSIKSKIRQCYRKN